MLRKDLLTISWIIDKFSYFPFSSAARSILFIPRNNLFFRTLDVSLNPTSGAQKEACSMSRRADLFLTCEVLEFETAKCFVSSAQVLFNRLSIVRAMMNYREILRLGRLANVTLKLSKLIASRCPKLQTNSSLISNNSDEI